MHIISKYINIFKKMKKKNKLKKSFKSQNKNKLNEDIKEYNSDGESIYNHFIQTVKKELKNINIKINSKFNILENKIQEIKDG